MHCETSAPKTKQKNIKIRSGFDKEKLCSQRKYEKQNELHCTEEFSKMADKVVNKQSYRPHLLRQNKAIATPSEKDTPRTLIQGLLGATSVSQSTIAAAKKRPRLTKSPQAPLPQKRRSLRKSIGDNETPRTLIKNFLIEASPETPLEIPHETMVKVSNHEKEKDKVQQQHADVNGHEEEISSPLPLLEQSNNKDLQILEINQPTETDIIEHEITDQVSATEEETSPKDTDISTPNPVEQSEDLQNREKHNSMPSALTTEMETSPEDTDISTPNPVEQSEDLQNIEKHNSMPSALATEMETSPKDTDISTPNPVEQSEDLQNREKHNSMPSALATEMETSPEDTDIYTPYPLEQSDDLQSREQDDSMPVGSLTNQWNKSKWKDLITPRLPVTTRKVLHEANKRDINLDHSRVKHSSTKNKKKPRNRTAVTRRTSSASVGLPSSLVKSIFEHFSKSRVSNEALQIIQKGSSLFFKQLSGDLMAYCQHAGRTTIETRDVELLMKRQGFVTSKQSLNSLIEKYLPMEYRQELIPVAQSGNKILLKK